MKQTLLLSMETIALRSMKKVMLFAGLLFVSMYNVFGTEVGKDYKGIVIQGGKKYAR